MAGMDKSRMDSIMEIEGYTSLREGLLLYSFASTLPKGAQILEIGSWKGRSTVWLASGLKDGAGQGHVYAVDHGIGDPDAGLQQTALEFTENIRKANVADLVTTIFKKSEEALGGWSNSVDMLFVDGAHDYENVKRDYRWEKFLADGGWLVFHDVLNPGDGPARVFIEEVLSSGNYENFGTVDSILFAQKKKGSHASPLRKAFLKLLLRISLFLTVLYKKAPKRGFLKRIVRILMKRVLRGLVSKTAHFRLPAFSRLNTVI